MKATILFFLLFTFGLSVQSQNQKNKLNISNANNPIVVINDSLLASISILKNVPSEKIVSLNILKEDTFSAKHIFIEKRESEGIVLAKLNHNFATKSQKELNKFFGLSEANDVYINGYLIENKNQSIATISIEKIEILQPDNLQLKKAVLNISID